MDLGENIHGAGISPEFVAGASGRGRRRDGEAGRQRGWADPAVSGPDPAGGEAGGGGGHGGAARKARRPGRGAARRPAGSGEERG